MSQLDWARLEALFHAAIPLAAADREALLIRECGEDAALRAAVVRLLAAHGRAGGFIEVPAAALAGALAPADDVSPVGSRVGAYRLVREVGRGGMGAVYLAERDDGAFAQRVAVKLIKRGMDTDQVLARFRAERQILASLDHPNIARLLDGGSTARGLPYFAMEFIDGRPIDAFAADRHLGVDERLRLFLQVCDAVAYAHGQGVVHRDIKPLNILVTPSGTPKLLDFGIAKVLHEAADDVTSTVTGFRLLTPEYASPEQVEGRHATVASDVYSLGVVLYELLTGRSPYRLASRAPQDIAAAVCTTEPDRPSVAVTRPGVRGLHHRGGDPAQMPVMTAAEARQLQRRLRGDLDTIVLGALRKNPTRRYATVAAFAEDIRRHLDGRPVLERADRLIYRAGKLVRRHRANVIVGAALLAAVVVALRLASERQSEPSLLSTGVLAARDRLLIADFTDTEGDTALAVAITDAFRVDLAQSPNVRVMTPRQVRTALERMERSADLAVNDSLARELAMREGVKAFVVGRVSRIAGRWGVNVELVGAESGEVLAAVRETAADSTGLIDAVDRASETLRHRLGESLRALRALPPLAQEVTASLPALRKYTAGMRLYYGSERARALPLLLEAVALDSTFATAHLTLSHIYDAIDEPGRAEEARRRAMAHLDRLPYQDRQFLIGSDAQARGDYDQARRAYSDFLARYPYYAPAVNNMALAERDARHLAVAESLWARSIELDSGIIQLYFGLHSAQLLAGKFADAQRTLDLIGRRAPNNSLLLVVEVQQAAAQQDWKAAERRAEANIAALTGDTLQSVDAFEQMAAVVMTQGRLAEAERYWRTQQTLAAASGSWGRRLYGAQMLGLLRLRFRNDTAGAVAVLDSALRRMPLDSMLPGDRPYGELARFFAATGDIRRARAMMARAEQSPRAGPGLRAEQAWNEGVILLAEGHPREAEPLLRRATDALACALCALPDLARARDAGGDSAGAVQTYERYLSTPWLFRYEIDAIDLAPALQRLAELYDTRGEGRRAQEMRTRLLALWRRADAELQPVLSDARTRLTLPER